MKVYDYQLDAIDKLACGKILCGGVGSGKSITSLGYYWITEGGNPEMLTTAKAFKLPNTARPLYIITTARKRDTKEWEMEFGRFGLKNVVVDSWNNIKKYQDVKNAFFIFDEQRLVGNGVWVKSFLKIAKSGNHWILLSATPGDNWLDYIPVFLANGFYKNRSEFLRDHVVYASWSKFPKVDRYLGTKKLNKLRNQLLVDMAFKRETKSHHINLDVGYDILEYKNLVKKRWNPDLDKPITSVTEYCYCLRKVVNKSEERQLKVLEICQSKPKVIIFYNFDYELDILKNLPYIKSTEIAEWNGHKHQSIPESNRWVYLVQYTAGAEGWNCTLTDTMIFYSQNYSYKAMVQAAGRIDRLTTKFNDLYYFHLVSKAPIDIAIKRTKEQKKKFNARGWCKIKFRELQ